MLTEITPLIRKLADQQDLTAEEARRALNLVSAEDQEGLYFFALLLGIAAKGPTADELYGFCLSLSDQSVKLSPKVDPAEITDISGTGGDRIKTFNIGTTASLVIAASGIYVAKQSTGPFTGMTGSADIFNEIGASVPFSEGDPRKVEECLEKVGIVPYYYPSFSRESFVGRIAVRNRMRESGLTFATPYHLVSWAFSPIEMKTRVYGVFSAKYLRALAQVFQKLGYERGLVVHGVDGIDEMSTIGPTKICEFAGGDIEEYTITPEEVGLERAKAEDIKAVSPERNVIDFLEILYGKERGPRRDIVLLNAAAALYVGDRAEDIREGVKMAESLIDEGKASQKVEDLVAFFEGQEKLERWKDTAGI